MGAAISIARCVLFVVLGVTLGLAGVKVWSPQGAIVWGALLGIALLDGCEAVRTYREGRDAGVRAAIIYLALMGKLK